MVTLKIYSGRPNYLQRFSQPIALYIPIPTPTKHKPSNNCAQLCTMSVLKSFCPPPLISRTADWPECGQAKCEDHNGTGRKRLRAIKDTGGVGSPILRQDPPCHLWLLREGRLSHKNLRLKSNTDPKWNLELHRPCPRHPCTPHLKHPEEGQGGG